MSVMHVEPNQQVTRLFVRAYTNSILLRRDAILACSTIKSTQDRAALRAQAPTQGSLFGPAAEEAVKAHVEKQQKALFFFFPTASTCAPGETACAKEANGPIRPLRRP